MEILGILLLVPLSGITIIALFAALTLLFPAPIEKTRLTLENGLGRSFLLGLVNFIFFAALAGLFGWLAQPTGSLLSGVLMLLVGLIVFGLAIFAIFGLTAFANVLGERMGSGKTPFTSILRGGILLLLAGLAPYVGWFIFTPLVLLVGLGATISTLVHKRDRASSTEETA